MSEPEFTYDDLLDATPVPNEAVEEEESEIHGHLLHIPHRGHWFVRMVSFLKPMNPRKTVSLDPLGLEVWRSCNGRRTIEDVIERFSAKHQVSFHEARIPVVQFLKMLTQNAVVVIVGRDQEDAAE